MNQSAMRDVCKYSLQVMKNSLTSSYELNSAHREQESFIEAWSDKKADYMIFSDYRRNEGYRRLQDILEIIDQALAKLETNEESSPSEIYLQTIKSVSMVKQWYSILEVSA